MRSVVETALDTAFSPEKLEIVFYIDEDDVDSQNTVKEITAAKAVIGPRIVLSQCWNECQKVASHDVYMHCGDDILFKTVGWDLSVMTQFRKHPDRIAFVYGRDGIQPNTFGTHGFIHKNWVDTVGYFVPPYFSCDYNDTWLNDVSKMIGRHFYIDIYTEHMHPAASKYIIDETHRERMARGYKDDVHKKYAESESLRRDDADKLKAFIANFNK